MSSLPTLNADGFRAHFQAIQAEMGRVVVGQQRPIEHLLAALLSGGHVLLTGMPGLGRTVMVMALAKILNLSYRRLQFTPDLLPTDITGTEVLQGETAGGARVFKFHPGPVFANFVLADEINRSPARTQAALLEVMQERQVTMGGNTHFLPRPFVLVATQNTLESEGVWPLGEAQADRFMMSIQLNYPTSLEEREILCRTTGGVQPNLKTILDAEALLAMQHLAERVPVVPSVRDFALAIVRASRVTEPEAPEEIRRAVRLGASPRTSQSLLRAAKVMALARGRTHASRQDVIDVAEPVLRHRLILDFRAQAEGRGFDYVFTRLLSAAMERTQPQVSRWTRPFLNFRREGVVATQNTIRSNPTPGAQS